jgi:hypothetical protein
MLDILALIFPVFAVVGLGFLAAATGLLPDKAGDHLTTFVFTFASPCLIFRLIGASDLPAAIPWGYWLSYFGVIALAWSVSHLVIRRVFALPAQDAVIAGFCVGQANLVMVGLPVLLAAYGPAAGPPIALLLGVNLPIMMTVASLLLEASGSTSARDVARRLARSLATHPILLGIVAGFLAHAAGFVPPAPLAKALDMMGAMAIPGALFALGMALRRTAIGASLPLVVYIVTVKLMVVPGLVWVAATRLFALPEVYVGAAVVFAAAPVGVNAFVVAHRYKAGVDAASGSIALSTALSVVTTAFWLWVLGVG